MVGQNRTEKHSLPVYFDRKNIVWMPKPRMQIKAFFRWEKYDDAREKIKVRQFKII